MSIIDATLHSHLDFGFNPSLFLSTFALIFVAELPDKTAFATVLLATRKHPIAVFIGAALAFAVQSLVAVTFGSFLGLLPEPIVKMGAAGLFMFFALSMWFRKGDEEKDQSSAPKEKRATFLKTATSAFVVIFLAEWGDLTQLATGALEAKHQSPITIFTASTLALWCVTAIAILVGNRLKKLIHPRTIEKVAAVAFAAVAIYLLLQLKFT